MATPARVVCTALVAGGAGVVAAVTTSVTACSNQQRRAIGVLHCPTCRAGNDVALSALCKASTSHLFSTSNKNSCKGTCMGPTYRCRPCHCIRRSCTNMITRLACLLQQARHSGNRLSVVRLHAVTEKLVGKRSAGQNQLPLLPHTCPASLTAPSTASAACPAASPGPGAATTDSTPCTT